MTEQATDTKPETTSPLGSAGRLPAAAQIKSGLDQMRGQLLLQLPEHVKVDRFIRICLTAVNNNPDLLSCDRRSFFTACLRAASDGLLPDGREGALVPFKDERTNKRIVVWLPMVNGLIKLIRQSGQIDSIGARIVYQREIDEKRFSFVISDGVEKLFHDPILYGERGAKVLVYAYARFKESGHVEYLPMHRDDVLKRKVMSRARTGPWQSWEDEMWLKTVLRGLAKRLPLSSDIHERVEREEGAQISEFEKMRDEAIATAAHQLGAQPPAQIESEVPEPAQGFEEVQEEQPPDDVAERGRLMTEASDQTELMVESMVEAAIAAMKPDSKGRSEEGNTPEELDDFADHMRGNIRQQPISEGLREALLNKFNAAVLEKRRVFAKSR